MGLSASYFARGAPLGSWWLRRWILLVTSLGFGGHDVGSCWSRWGGVRSLRARAASSRTGPECRGPFLRERGPSPGSRGPTPVIWGMTRKVPGPFRVIRGTVRWIHSLFRVGSHGGAWARKSARVLRTPIEATLRDSACAAIGAWLAEGEAGSPSRARTSHPKLGPTRAGRTIEGNADGVISSAPFRVVARISREEH